MQDYKAVVETNSILLRDVLDKRQLNAIDDMATLPAVIIEHSTYHGGGQGVPGRGVPSSAPLRKVRLVNNDRRARVAARDQTVRTMWSTCTASDAVSSAMQTLCVCETPPLLRIPAVPQDVKALIKNSIYTSHTCICAPQISAPGPRTRHHRRLACFCLLTRMCNLLHNP
jgi:hypothetical protein